MATGEQSAVVGVFRDRALAEQAINDLRQISWDTNQVKLLERRGGSGGGFGMFRNVFAGHESAARNEESGEDELAQLDLLEEQRQLYQHELESGACLVVVHSSDRLLEIRDTLHRYGAFNVILPLRLGGERTIPVRQEVAQVLKHVVDVGEIRVHKRVITEEKTFTVPVTREEVYIERLPRNANTFSSPQSNAQPQALFPDAPLMRDPNRNATDTTAGAPPEAEEVLSDDGTIRILVHEEQVIINKQPVIVEEIVIHKRIVQDTKHLVEPIRHEEVQIERIGNAPVREG